MIAPVIKQHAAELAGRTSVGKLDVDQNPQTAARFQARRISLLVILNNGREVDRRVGVQSKEAILRQLQTHL